MKRKRVCFVVAVPMTVTAFLNAHIERLADDYDVFVVSNFSAGDVGVSPRAERVHVDIAREISPVRDVTGLLQLAQVFRKYRFDIVHSVTPKAGLLSMTAGFIARIPVRIHWFTGQVWVTRRGAARLVLKSADRLIATLATHLLADSPSQRDFLVGESVCSANRIEVIGDGSICGVDGQRFKPDSEARVAIREAHGIGQDKIVILFLGRLNIDKGVREMAQAMCLIDADFPDVHWLVVGPDEEGMVDHLKQAGQALGSRLHFQGFTRQPEAYMAAADIFCLPSYREGFGSSVLEAAAAGVPSVASRIYGLSDAVEDNVTGILVESHDASGLAQALTRLLSEPRLTGRMGEAARARALNQFSASRVVDGLYAFYRRIVVVGDANT
jgi:glycosyltransferase involved in cell wall biosynthesis